VVFEDGAYLELIAWEAPGPAERWYNVHAKHGDGLIDFALVPQDTAGAIAAARARGLALDGPIDGGRLRPDGQQVKWQTGRQATFDLPFLCGDVTPRELRVPTGDVRKHANGVVGVASVAVAVMDLETSLSRYRALLGIGGVGGAGATEQVDAPVVLPGLGLRIASVRLGTTAIVLTSPSGTIASGEGGRPAGELSRRLAARGEGPYAMALRTTQGGEARALAGTLTHNAGIELGRYP
jgi:hypothetical protein